MQSIVKQKNRRYAPLLLACVWRYASVSLLRELLEGNEYALCHYLRAMATFIMCEENRRMNRLKQEETNHVSR